MVEMALMATVHGMDLEAVEIDQEMEGEAKMEMEEAMAKVLMAQQVLVEGQAKEDGVRVDLVDQEALEVQQEELEVLEVLVEWEAADLTAIVPGMVLAAAMETPIGRERNLEEAEKENH